MSFESKNFENEGRILSLDSGRFQEAFVELTVMSPTCRRWRRFVIVGLADKVDLSRKTGCDVILHPTEFDLIN